MADTTVDANVFTTTYLRNLGLQGPYWIDTQTAIIVFIDSGTDISFSRTTDGGTNWSNTVIVAGDVNNFVCWFDQETPGDSGTEVHIAWLDETDGTAYYVNVDISDGSKGTIRTIDSGITVASTSSDNRIALTKTVGGNLLMALSTQTEIECYRSVDSGVNWVDRIDVFETATEEDWCLLYPASTTDDNDVAALFIDRSAQRLTVKMYDDSANTWTESSANFVVAVPNQTYINMDGAVRHSDGAILCAIHKQVDSAVDDLKLIEWTTNSISTPVRTIKTDIYTDQDESAQASVIINQQNDDIYVAYLKGGTWTGSTDVVFHKSTDDGLNWGAEQSYSETTDDYRLVHGGRTIGSSGGRVQWSWFNDDLNDIFVNLVNDLEIVADIGTTVLPSTVTLTSSLFAPTIKVPTVVSPSTLELTSAVLDVTIATTGNKVMLPEPFALSLTLFPPTPVLPTSISVSPDTLTITSSVLAPSVVTPGTKLAQSLSIDFNNGEITTAKMTATYTGNDPTLTLTADGTNFESVTNGVAHTFSNTGTDLKWRINATGTTVTNVLVEDYH